MDRKDVVHDTVKVDKYKVAAQEKNNSYELYKGLQIHALPGLHKFAVEILQNQVPVKSAVLDLGAGSGAMSQRLLDAGFKVTSADIVTENFKLCNKDSFVTINFNTQFSKYLNETFDAIVAVEIIEHLENPRNFIRECRKLLSPGGVLLISSPNLDSPVSKAFFVRYGTYKWFLDKDYETEGHILPVSQWLLKKCIYEAGLTVCKDYSYGDTYKSLNKWWAMRILSKLISIVSLCQKRLEGEIYILVSKLEQ